MAWRAGRRTTKLVAIAALCVGCAPQTRAACVPRLVVHLSAADRQAARAEGQGEVMVRRGRWDVVVHAELRWRTPSRSSFSYPVWP